jgi:hypothetical protein
MGIPQNRRDVTVHSRLFDRILIGNAIASLLCERIDFHQHLDFWRPFCFSSHVPTLQAQYENGSLVGTIRDTSGAAVFGAVVTITNNATAVTAKVTTNGAGDYEIPSLRVGVYTSQRALQASRAPSRKTSPFQLAVVSASIYR